MKEKTSILFVCMGNICRSPTAHGVMDNLIKSNQKKDFYQVDSAGTIDYHKGNKPDSRAISKAHEKGLDISYIRSRPIAFEDYFLFDYILAMDNNNLSEILAQKPNDSKTNISLFLSILHLDQEAQANKFNVPDPYYGGATGFESVFNLVSRGCNAWFKKLEMNDG